MKLIITILIFSFLYSCSFNKIDDDLKEINFNLKQAEINLYQSKERLKTILNILCKKNPKSCKKTD